MKSSPRIIAITGGIGSGKSVVSRMLTVMGFRVYDTDSRAKRLMDSDERLKRRLVTDIHPAAVDLNGAINRKVIADTVFGDSARLNVLNNLVHGAVKDDFAAWCGSDACSGESVVFVECAILYSSGFDALVDEVWEVTAPDDVRIERVMKRNCMSADDVRRRIGAQKAETGHDGAKLIVNDGFAPLLPQIYLLITNESLSADTGNRLR